MTPSEHHAGRWPARGLRLIAAVGAVVAIAAGADRPSAQAPPDRPRSRPPSELTGWADWENAAALLKRITVPPAPVLDPAEARETFRLAPGYRLELVASEPLVDTPIFFEFDPDGRIWVVEYQGYMRDLQGTGEGDPICRIVVLEDEDEDGRADRRTVFLDGLVMPRSLAFVKGGVLVAEPPTLWFCPDANGDLRCDGKVRAGSYGRGGNPQHTANGLRYGLDNWLHSADIPRRHRFVDGALVEAETILRGQFGVTFDDEGRFLTSRENRALLADLIPAEYVHRHPALVRSYQESGSRKRQFGIEVDIAPGPAQHVFPSRVTPAVTLGALELRDDGRLKTYTVVSGSTFYDGHQFPPDAYGNVFVPESGGHLVGRLALSGGTGLEARRFYPDEQELLTSTDERFRPVNGRVGPDGALYVADMYRGIIEHVIFMVPYLEQQIRERRLDQGLDRGRLYRIVHQDRPIDRRRPRLSTASTGELVGTLSHANGWHRLTAQRLLVERRDTSAVAPLQVLARTGGSPLGRLHALWTLQGLQALDARLLAHAGRDPDDRVRAASVRLLEHLEPRPAPRATLADLRRRLADPSGRVRLQATLTAGTIAHRDAAGVLLAALTADRDPLIRTAVMTGSRGREIALLDSIVAWPRERARAEADTARWLAELVMRDGNPRRVEQLLGTLAGTEIPELATALLTGMAAAVPARPGRAALTLDREPVVLRRLARANDEATRRLARRVQTAVTWPGASELPPDGPAAAPLSPADRTRAAAGKQVYAQVCAACHQLDGGGIPQVAPRLADSEWVTGPGERLIRIVLHGLYGPIEVQGEPWNRHMPGLGAALSDEQVAGTLTYVRRAWGHTADPIAPETVTQVRQAHQGRTLAWSAGELAGAAPAAAATATGPIRPDDGGRLHLPSRLATTYGRELAYRPSLDVLAPWRHEHDVAEWTVETKAPREYEVLVTLAADEASAGDRFVVSSGTSAVTGTVQASGGYDTFTEYAVGRIRLDAGLERIVMRPEGALRRELADVRALRLVPVAPR